MARLNTSFYKARTEAPLTQVESAVSYYIFKNSPCEDYNELIKNDGRHFIKRAFSDYRQSVLRWYPFKKDSSVLEIGADFGAVTGALCDACGYVAYVEGSLFKAQLVSERYCSRENLCVYAGKIEDIKFEKKFDYIVCLEALGNLSSPLDLVRTLRSLLADDGILLLGASNRYGAQFFAGKKDSFSCVPFDGLDNIRSQSNLECRFDRADMESLFKKAGFRFWKFYYPTPDHFFPRALYSDQGLPETNVNERLLTLHEDMSAFVCDDKSLLVAAARNGAFPFLANDFLVELSDMENVFSKAKSMTLNGGYRARGKAFATIINGDGTVQKKALYTQGKEYAARLCNIAETLSKRGLLILPMRLDGDSVLMDFVKAPTVQNYLRSALDLPDAKERFLRIFEVLWNDIMRSSDLSDSCALDTNGLDVGPLLTMAYLEMVTINSFWLDGKIMYFDQELARENWPAKYVLYRSVNFVYGGISDVDSVLARDELLGMYEISAEMAELFNKWESILSEVENPYQNACKTDLSADTVLANRLKLAGGGA